MKEKLVIALIVIAALLLLGATGHTNKPFVARANFSPQVAKATEIAHIVTEEVQRVEVTTPPPTASQGASGDATQALSGGYALPYGNCVDELRAAGHFVPSGNPISWQPTSQTPWIGAAALFRYNHTALVVGIVGDSVVVRHRNYAGGQYVFPISSLRGFF